MLWKGPTVRSMVAPNPSRPDEYEQTGAGLRELHQRLNAATTRGEFQWITVEAERRAVQPGLDSSIETAYGVLASLAHKRVAALSAGEPTGAEGDA
jgi:hypothetical protein